MKGKEYDLNGMIEFEGKYLNGERIEKRKVNNFDVKLDFEGVYLNRKRKYDIDDKLNIKAEYLNGTIIEKNK